MTWSMGERNVSLIDKKLFVSNADGLSVHPQRPNAQSARSKTHQNGEHAHHFPPEALARDTSTQALQENDSCTQSDGALSQV